jgi:hypothetical protein
LVDNSPKAFHFSQGVTAVLLAIYFEQEQHPINEEIKLRKEKGKEASSGVAIQVAHVPFRYFGLPPM